jgi:uncharacterized protein
MPPISEAEILALQQTILWAAFGVSLALGWVMSWSNFCTMGAVADIVNMSDWTRMRMWLAAIGVAILGTHVLAGLGYIDLSKSIYTAPKLLWLSTALGGALFGFGMVLASGCGSKTLVRIGGGSLKSLVVFLVLGISAYMTLKGLFAVWRVGTVDTVSVTLSSGQDLARMLSTKDSLNQTRLVLGVAVGAALLLFALRSPEFRQRHAFVGSVGVGAAVVIMWWISGHLGHVAEHPKTLEEAYLSTNTQRMEALSFVAPMAYTLELLMFWSDTSKVLTLGIVTSLGVIVGAFIHAIQSKTFRWDGFRDAQDTANHLIGAVLMGAGGVLAMGCTIGQGLSGLSTLALGSIIAFLCIVAGAWAGLSYQMWRINSQD